MTIEILFAEVQRLNRQLEDLRLQSDMRRKDVAQSVFMLFIVIQ
jgi:hypothetical protein